jgi:hypothetical protein
MNILLVNIDSKIPNLALEKIKMFYKAKGDTVEEIQEVHYTKKRVCTKSKQTLPLNVSEFDKIFVSCVFDWNIYRCRKWEDRADKIGGSGYSLTINLPKEIEELKPKINYGFATRGCPRRCIFCVVHKKEGNIRIEGDIYDIWDGCSKEITLMDNNILALPEHFFKISAQLKKEDLKVDFNQGLDFRLLTPEICKELFSMKFFREIRFSFDDISYKPMVIKKLKMLREYGMKDWQTRWYVYVGTKDTVDTVLERVNLLRDNKQLVYLMRDRAVRSNPLYQEMLEWCNFVGMYKSTPFYRAVSKSKKEQGINRGNPLNIFIKE